VRKGAGREVPLTLLHPPRSICLSCGATISWYDNLPIFSYLWLRGRCRLCGAPIGLRTLLLEVATPLIVLGIASILGFTEQGCAAGLFASWLGVALPIRWERRHWPGRRWPRGFTVLGWCLAGWLGMALWAFVPPGRF
jgi:prepilin signal peptidase PulO-like enzyme (type II secretory pathway)